MSQKIYTNLDIKGNTTIGSIANATTDTDKFLVSDNGLVKYRTGAEMLSDLGINAGAPTSSIQHQVKAAVAISKGQAVYVSSADGTNMIVSLASNASEATSSKTMGLLADTVAINGFSNVVAEGLLAGLNTSTAAAGDPVWLGTGGNLIYGLINKPYAPAHLVFIGIVTRSNNVNGEIFVKVQNGFELNEIHDVDLKTTVPINGHILGFDGSLWVNKTIAGWLGYTPADASHTHTFDSLTSKTGGTGTYTTSGDFRAPIFYDSNNTGYYTDPASTSNLNLVSATNYTFTGASSGAIGLVTSTSAFRTLSGDGTTYGYGISTNTSGGLDIMANQAGQPIRFWAGTTNVTPIQRMIISAGDVTASASFRAPIFYDSGNTSYYVDPASTSNLVGLTVANTINGNISGSAETVDGIDSSRIIYGDNATGTLSISNTTLDGVLKSGFYTVGTGGIPNATSVNFVMHTSYAGLSNQAGFDLACNDSTTSSFYLRPATGGGKGAWQTIVTSSNVSSYAASTSHTHTFDSLTSKIGGTGTYQTAGDFRAPIFYDSNNTAYYTDPASTSVLNRLSISFNDATYQSGITVTNTNTGAQAIAGVTMFSGVHSGSINMFSSGYMDLLNQNTTNGTIQFRPKATVSMYIDNVSSTSRVTIGGSNTASHPLRVTQQVSNVSIYADYDIVAYSDQSVKENIRPIENVLDRVSKSRGVLYDRIDSGEKNNIGFIAQELEVEFPELVVTNEDNTKAVKYQNAVAVLFEAVKEQQKQIEELKELVNKLITK